MSEDLSRGRIIDSRDVVELMMAVEQAIDGDRSLTPAQRERLLHDIEARIQRGEFGDMDDLDDNALGILVRKLGPRGPSGHAGATVRPDDGLDSEAPGPGGYAN